MSVAIGGTTTFDKVRDEALNALGMSGAAPLDPDAINSLMLLGLEQIYTRVWQFPKYQHTWTLVVAAGERNPGDTTVDVIFDPMYRIIERATRVRSGVDDKELLPATKHPDDDVETDASPTTIYWYRWGDEFWITPYSDQSETYKFRGYREPDRVLYTVSSGTVTWAEVDLPDECIEIYQHFITGFIANALGDRATAQQWVSIGADALNNLLERNNGRVMRQVAPHAPLYMGGSTSGPDNLGPGPVLWYAGD